MQSLAKSFGKAALSGPAAARVVSQITKNPVSRAAFSRSISSLVNSPKTPLEHAIRSAALTCLHGSPLAAAPCRSATATSSPAATALAVHAVRALSTAAAASEAKPASSAAASPSVAAGAGTPPPKYFDPSNPASDASTYPVEALETVVKPDAAVASWLFAVAGLIFVMVVIGGITRLTRSGLSMVHWKFTGERRPVTPEDWEAEFALYKDSPEYRLYNTGMSMTEFKFIYAMEYAHRTLGRLLGLAYGVPFLGFLATRRLPVSAPLTKLLTGALALGGLQGYIGWWMVRSGLTEETSVIKGKVSPYRLATHLISAFTLFGLLGIAGFQVSRGKFRLNLSGLRARLPKAASPKLTRIAHMAAGFAGLTAFSGAFVAGNEAGLIYNEFPLMGGKVIPSDLIDPYITPTWRNAFEHPTFVQFTHRCLAITTTALTIGAFALSRNKAHTVSPLVKRAASLMMLAVAMQASLGIATLYSHVQTHVAATHQAGALVLIASAVNLMSKVANPAVAATVAGPVLLPALGGAALGVGILAKVISDVTGKGPFVKKAKAAEEAEEEQKEEGKEKAE